MLSAPGKISLRVKKEANDFTSSSFPDQQDITLQGPIDISSSSSSSSSEDESCEAEDEDVQCNKNANNQLVLYEHFANGAIEPVSEPNQLVLYDHSANGAIEPVPDPSQYHVSPSPRYSTPNPTSRVLPSVGAFTVQCANCFKWRFIPTKEKYEEIREHILEQPFYCETAREWRPDISCDDAADLSQDGSRLWAIDKPNIAQPPPGWQRLLRIRGEGSTKFADIYYEAPSGKRLRSMVEIQKYLLEHPEYLTDGVTLSQFSFQIPKPLQENYVRKRPARMTDSCESAKHLEPGEVNPLAWAGPDDSIDLQLNRPALPPPPYFEAPVFDPVGRPAKKKPRVPLKKMYSSEPNYNQQGVRVDGHSQS